LLNCFPSSWVGSFAKCRSEWNLVSVIVRKRGVIVLICVIVVKQALHICNVSACLQLK